MLYLGWLVVRWILRALIPATFLFAAGALLSSLAWLFFLRRRRRTAMALWVVVGSASLGFMGWRTWEVWTDFTRPQVRMFRNYIADPVPRSISQLAMATPAPAMFHDGAIIRFQVTPAALRQILDHSLPGSTTLGVIEEMKRQSARDPSNRWVMAGADGRSYLKVDLQGFSSEEGPEAFRWARSRVTEAVRGGPREVYVLLLEGEWGSFQSVLTYDAVQGTAEVYQYLERKRKVTAR